MTAGACAHIDAIETVKHPRRRECEECVKSVHSGSTCACARNAGQRRCIIWFSMTSSPNTGADSPFGAFQEHVRLVIDTIPGTLSSDMKTSSEPNINHFAVSPVTFSFIS